MTKVALRPEPLEINEDLELITSQPTRSRGNQLMVVFDDDAQWRHVREKRPGYSIEVYIASFQGGPQAIYRRAISGWLEAKIYFERPFGSAAASIDSCSPESALSFFECAEPHEFAVFCDGLKTRLAINHVARRVQAVSSLLAIRWQSPDDGNTSRLFGSDSYALSTRLQLQGGSKPEESVEREAARTKLAEILQLMEISRIDAGLDQLYKWIDQLLREGSYALLEFLFQSINIQESPVDLIIGILIATLPVKTRVRSRQSFLEMAKRALEMRGESEEGLFDGLS